MVRRIEIRCIVSLALAASCLTCTSLPPDSPEPTYHVQPELLIEQFSAAEGITFNGEGELFVAADRSVWGVSPDGSVEQLAEIDSKPRASGNRPSRHPPGGLRTHQRLPARRRVGDRRRRLAHHARR